MKARPIFGSPLTNRLNGLDLLRALAIVWVMCFHSFLVGGFNQHFVWLQRFGWMGVDLFFVLSGFLIGSQVLSPLARGEPFHFRDFYIRRAFRILPAFWVVLALYLSFPWFREAPGLESWWKFATFTLNLLINYDQNQASSHAWSLCIEEHFYLFFPLLAWLLVRRLSAISFTILIVTCVSTGIALGTDLAKANAFREAFRTLGRRIDLFLSLPLATLDRLALSNEVREIGKGP